jgi:hypothetical protein
MIPDYSNKGNVINHLEEKFYFRKGLSSLVKQSQTETWINWLKEFNSSGLMLYTMVSLEHHA